MTLVNQEVHTDPVCHMRVDGNSAHHLIHRGITQWFCSMQCLESFKENPDLYVGLHHVANAPAVLKERKVTLDFNYKGAEERFLKMLDQSMGIVHSAIAAEVLYVEYDLRQITWAQIERKAIQSGVSFSGFVAKVRRALWRFTERNELKNLAHWSDAACCNHPPSSSK